MSDFDILLHRPLQNGGRFEKLIPKTNCGQTDLGSGYTDFSIDYMVRWVREYSWQMEEVAALLQKGSLKATCDAIYQFLYDHFQYKADGTTQVLRSPSCSWKQREAGIDCKSYSIIASSLLREMGISHYIRKIKQPGFEPSEYTHVYVVVPLDQQSNDLKKGYHTIDGTTHDNIEPRFITAKDEFMEGLPHIGLNGAHQGLNGFDFKDIGGMFSNFKCLGNSAYTESDYNAMQTKVPAYFQGIIDRINAAISGNNAVELGLQVAVFKVTAQVFVKIAETKLAERSWNSPCTVDRLKGNIAMFKYYRDTVGPAMDSWLAQYFTSEAGGDTVTYSAGEPETKLGFSFMYLGVFQQIQQSTSVVQPRYKLKSGVSEVKQFVVTPYLQQAAAGTSFNLVTFLSGLTAVAATFTPSGNGNTAVNTDPGTSLSDGLGNKPKDSKNAGFGMGLMGVMLGIGVIGFALTNSTKNKAK